jgi:hypothetical protein
LQVTYRHTAGYGLTFLGAYTIQKDLALAAGSADQAEFLQPFDPFNPGLSYGPANYDVPQILSLSYVWNLPSFTNTHGPLSYVAKGWIYSGTFTAKGGGAITVLSGLDNSLSGIGEDHANQVGHASLPGGRSRGQQINEWFNTQNFVVNPIGTYGNTATGILRGPGASNWDMSLFKTFQLRESVQLQLRGDFANALNHVVLGGVNSRVSSGAFGTIGNTGSPRIIQLSARLLF